MLKVTNAVKLVICGLYRFWKVDCRRSMSSPIDYFTNGASRRPTGHRLRRHARHHCVIDGFYIGLRRLASVSNWLASDDIQVSARHFINADATWHEVGPANRPSTDRKWSNGPSSKICNRPPSVCAAIGAWRRLMPSIWATRTSRSLADPLSGWEAEALNVC